MTIPNYISIFRLMLVPVFVISLLDFADKWTDPSWWIAVGAFLVAVVSDGVDGYIARRFKQRGMLDATLVIWGGEFGRTNYCQGTLGKDNFGRDHHGRCFSLWMAGGGAKGGTVVGQTDDYGYNVVKDGVHVHDFHATLLHLLGIDHERLTFKYQGRYFRLTDVHGNVVRGALT